MPYRFLVHGGYVELELFGVLGTLERFSTEEWELIRATKAVLYTYANGEGIAYNPETTSEATRRMVARGVRLASLAEQPVWFGVNRQIIQWGHLEHSVRVFTKRSEAVAWLVRGQTT